LDEDHADGYYNLGVAYAFKEDATKAKEMLERALTIQPDHLLAGHALTIINENNIQ
jgi:Tfp pilus assembly protein PilF